MGVWSPDAYDELLLSKVKTLLYVHLCSCTSAVPADPLSPEQRLRLEPAETEWLPCVLRAVRQGSRCEPQDQLGSHGKDRLRESAEKLQRNGALIACALLVCFWLVSDYRKRRFACGDLHERPTLRPPPPMLRKLPPRASQRAASLRPLPTTSPTTTMEHQGSVRVHGD